MSAALEGDLARFFPAEILQLLSLAQADGRLELVRGSERAELFVERGRPVFARTDGAAVRVGQVLVHRGAVSAQAVDEALALQGAARGRRLGELLVERGLASAPQVEDAVRETLRRVVYGVLLWREGRFRFHPGERAGGGQVRLDLDLDRLILEGLRQADERGAG
jgi:hypothetical protein